MPYTFHVNYLERITLHTHLGGSSAFVNVTAPDLTGNLYIYRTRPCDTEIVDKLFRIQIHAMDCEDDERSPTWSMTSSFLSTTHSSQRNVPSSYMPMDTPVKTPTSRGPPTEGSASVGGSPKAFVPILDLLRIDPNVLPPVNDGRKKDEYAQPAAQPAAQQPDQMPPFRLVVSMPDCSQALQVLYLAIYEFTPERMDPDHSDAFQRTAKSFGISYEQCVLFPVAQIGKHVHFQQMVQLMLISFLGCSNLLRQLKNLTLGAIEKERPFC